MKEEMKNKLDCHRKARQSTYLSEITGSPVFSEEEFNLAKKLLTKRINEKL